MFISVLLLHPGVSMFMHAKMFSVIFNAFIFQGNDTEYGKMQVATVEVKSQSDCEQSHRRKNKRLKETKNRDDTIFCADADNVGPCFVSKCYKCFDFIK